MPRAPYPTTIAKVSILLLEGSYGWSENFYVQLPTATTPLANIIANTGQFAAARLALSPGSVVCRGVRISRPSEFRDVRFLVAGTQGIPFTGTYTPPGAPISAPSTVALLFRVEGGELHRRSFLMRGLPAAIVSTQGTYDPAAALGFSTALTGFQSWMTGGIGAFKSNLLLIRDPSQQIQGFSWTGNPQPNNLIQIQTLAQITITPPGGPPRALATGDFVILRGWRGGTRINGVWPVFLAPAAAPWEYSLGPPRKPAAFGTSQGNPGTNIQPLVFAVASIDAFGAERLVSRRTGRPFGQPVGRRAAR